MFGLYIPDPKHGWVKWVLGPKKHVLSGPQLQLNFSHKTKKPSFSYIFLSIALHRLSSKMNPLVDVSLLYLPIPFQQSSNPFPEYNHNVFTNNCQETGFVHFLWLLLSPMWLWINYIESSWPNFHQLPLLFYTGVPHPFLDM